FTDLAIDCAGSNYTLQVTSSGAKPLVAAVSAPFNVNTGLPEKLLFAVSPSNTRANQTLYNYPVVQVVDAGNNRVPTYSGTISIAITPASVKPGAVLSGTSAVYTTSGESRYFNLAINRAGAGYTLTASTADGLSGVSAAFNITATQLRFGTIANTPAGAALGVVVEATDDDGVLDTTFTGTVALRVVAPAVGVDLKPAANPSVAAVAGVATFGSSMGINIDRVGQGYQLGATSGTLNGKSALFNITASQLRFSSEPGDTRAGATFGAEVVATDSYGTIDTTFTGQVTLGLTGGAGGVSLKPAASPMVTAVNGRANFGTALVIDRVGQAYKLSATSGSMNAFSSAFNITANQLRFSTSPGNTQAGTQFNVEVEATDNFGNVDTTFTSPVTLWLSGGALLATLEPSGALTATAADGQASFSGLHIDRIGQGYTLLASGGGLNGKSALFNITASQFRFSPAPGNTRADATFAVTVLATDGYGSIDTTFTSSVTLGLVGGTDGAILSSPGSLTIAAVNGQAPFSGLS
ncbi:MAG TPA: hypothetical protein VFT99_04765, partial [Roseiflexaceae bacterium]|nr:hypothetical protein [Roseiflexaceae bacterium]